MQFWWVNQNQTHREEITGGYLWSPKRKRDGSASRYYDNMTRVQPGDLVFSYFDTHLQYLGFITSSGYTHPRPVEMGPRGEVWGHDGWKVDVQYRRLNRRIRPKDHMDLLEPLLPLKYSPLRANGDGIQSVYLTELPEPLAHQLLALIGDEAFPTVVEAAEQQGEASADTEDRLAHLITQSREIPDTEKEAIVKARKGQGRFREDVLALHGKCPFTGVSNPEFLRAGHLKPWCQCSTNQERLDPLNGIPVTPVADQLLDRGFMTFDEGGRALFSPRLAQEEVAAMGIDPGKEYRIEIRHERQRAYLTYHREHCFRR